MLHLGSWHGSRETGDVLYTGERKLKRPLVQKKAEEGKEELEPC